MKIIIVGAGVAGLSLYLQLRKTLPDFNSHTILIFESHRPSYLKSTGDDKTRILSEVQHDLTDSAAVVGNSIALVPSAVRLLKSIDTNVYDLFKSRGYHNENYTFKTARGHKLAMMPAGDQGVDAEPTVSCPRGVLTDCFRKVVGEDKITYRKVIEVQLNGDNPVVRFLDGGHEDADLVVGADGIRSVVKKAMFDGADEQLYAPHFEGFCGVGAFVEMDIPESVTRHKSMVFTFGPTGSFGYCSAAPSHQRQLGWWSNWGHPQIPEHNILDPVHIQSQVRERHGGWQDPVIQTILEKMITDRIYPIWTTPDLPHWGAATPGAVLLGDAAHTLQATSGQGASQALEDSVTFSLLLAHYLTRTKETENDAQMKKSIQLSAQGFYEIRSPRVATIRNQARNLYLTSKRIDNIVIEYLYYCFIYLWTNFSLIGDLIAGRVFTSKMEWSVEKEVELYIERSKY